MTDNNLKSLSALTLIQGFSNTKDRPQTSTGNSSHFLPQKIITLTKYLAALFFVTSLTLAILASNRQGPESILDAAPAAPVETTAPAEPAQPGVPLSQ